jgi:hypothetical protein
MKTVALFALLSFGSFGTAGLAGCVDHQAGIEGTQSLHVELIGPANPGTPESRLPDDARAVTLRVQAIDESNEIDTTFDGDVDVYAQFLGTLTPELGDAPLAHVTLTDGQSAQTDLDLPPVYGPTLLWVEDSGRADATYATGTSETLWFRDPHMQDISRPIDEMSLDALESSPLENKQVTVSGSRYGVDGRLVVTGVYAQGYTLSDSQCGPGGVPPCVTGDYDHVLVFSFSRPRDENGNNIELGETIDGFAGAIQEFNGLTEIGFPQTFVEDENPSGDPAMVPPPSLLQASFLTDTYEMERRESSLVEVDNAVICPLDDDYTTYKQWKLDIGAGCGSPVNVITAGVVDFDPTTYVGMTIPKVIGTLRPVNISAFNVWIMYPRFADDMTLP